MMFLRYFLVCVMIRLLSKWLCKITLRVCRKLVKTNLSPVKNGKEMSIIGFFQRVCDERIELAQSAGRIYL